jgi:hypothetical protein
VGVIKFRPHRADAIADICEFPSLEALVDHVRETTKDREGVIQRLPYSFDRRIDRMTWLITCGDFPVGFQWE